MQEKYYGRLVAAFNDIDPEVAFTNITSLGMLQHATRRLGLIDAGTTILTGQQKEKRSFNEFCKILEEIYRTQEAKAGDNVMNSLHEAYSELPEKQRCISESTWVD